MLLATISPPHRDAPRRSHLSRDHGAPVNVALAFVAELLRDLLEWIGLALGQLVAGRYE